MIIKKIIDDRLFKRKWRRKNAHNYTYTINWFNQELVSVGKETYGSLTVLTFNNSNTLKIGNFCSIASGVVFAVSSEHCTSHISTFPFKVKTLQTEMFEAFSKGDIIVEDDVWIGQGSIILSGVTIGQGSVIAAGSVVTESVQPYTIVGGIPARFIKYRFNRELIDELNKIDYSKLSRDDIKNHINELYEDLTDKKQIGWMPKKQ